MLVVGATVVVMLVVGTTVLVLIVVGATVVGMLVLVVGTMVGVPPVLVVVGTHSLVGGSHLVPPLARRSHVSPAPHGLVRHAFHVSSPAHPDEPAPMAECTKSDLARPDGHKSEHYNSEQSASKSAHNST